MRSLPKFSLEEFLAQINQKDQKRNIWVALDHLQDTQNIGSILRSCLYFDVKNIFLTRHRSPNPSPTISKFVFPLEAMEILNVSFFFL